VLLLDTDAVAERILAFHEACTIDVNTSEVLPYREELRGALHEALDILCAHQRSRISSAVIKFVIKKLD